MARPTPRHMQRILNASDRRAPKPYSRPARSKPQVPQVPLQESNEEHAVVFTDGSAKSNGRSNARAGCGVFFGTDDPRNIACRVPTELPQTNQVGELLAMTLAMETLKKAGESKNIIIYSDSSYGVQGINSWINGWKRNRWMTSQNKPVLHDAIWKRLDEARQGLKVEFIHIRGHCGIVGNEAADRLAVSGAMMD